MTVLMADLYSVATFWNICGKTRETQDHSTRGLAGVSISTMDVRPGVGPFCNGQITWEDGPSPGRTVRRVY